MKHFYFFLFLLLPLYCYSQNLVPNPSFENYNSCPYTQAQIQYSPGYSMFPTVTDWINPMEWSSSDYLNTCATPTSGMNLPDAFIGQQNARTGDGVAGIIARADGTIDEYGEYIECRLLQPMKAGYNYEVTFYVNYAGLRGDWVKNYVAIDKIGAHFSNTVVYDPVNYILAKPFHIVSTPGVFLSDSVNWMKITGVYTSKGGEEWMTIGSFLDAANPVLYTGIFPTTPIIAPGYNFYNYYFIDDVSVTELPKCDTTYAVHDTNICEQRVNLNLSSAQPTWPSHSWNTGATTSNITANDTGVYWCIAKSGCNIHTDTFRISGIKNYQSHTRDTVICPPDTIVLQPRLGGAQVYGWSDSSIGAVKKVWQEGVYWCRYIIDCTQYTDTFHIVHLQPVQKIHLGWDTTMCKEDMIVLGKKTNRDITYKWNTGSEECCITPSGTGTYILTVSDGCTSASDTINLEMRGCYDCLLMPTAFTPNQDGKNDLFRPVMKCPVADYSIHIYDRWGQLLFESTDPQAGWNGTFNGASAEVGAYYYYMRYRPLVNVPIKLYKGDITLIR